MLDIYKKVTCYVPLSSSTGTYRQKVICYVPLSSNAGTYTEKVICYVPLSISTGTYRQKIIYYVPLVLSCGTYKTIFLYMSQLYKKEGHNQELFLYISFNLPIALILPDRQLSYHFLKPFRTLPDILLRNSIIPVHLPEIRPISAHHPRRAGCGATETFICFFY